jgi:hypothetical protein
MNDAQLSALRREPPPEFVSRLKASLHTDEIVRPAERGRRPLARIAASVVVVAAMGALFTVPAVRASARSFLAKFRVVNFVAIEVDESHAEALKSRELDLPDLIGEQLQILQDPGAPVTAVSPEQAGAAAGLELRLPSWLPPDVAMTDITVEGPGLVRVTADTTRLEQVMDFLGIDDLEVPSGLHGKIADVRVPSIVTIGYEVGRPDGSGAYARFRQARSPEITLPEGVNLAALGEIGLRILGMPADEARQFSRTIDWRTTLLVPVPPGVSSFKHVDVNGNQGVAIERWFEVENSGDSPGAVATLTGQGQAVRTRRRESVLLWSADGRVFGFEGSFSTESFLRMAYSIQ